MGLGLDPNKQAGAKQKPRKAPQMEFDDGVDYDNLDYSIDQDPDPVPVPERVAQKRSASPQRVTPERVQAVEQEDYDDLVYDDQLANKVFKGKPTMWIILAAIGVILFFVIKSFIGKDSDETASINNKDKQTAESSPTEQTAGATIGSNVGDTPRKDAGTSTEDDPFELGVPSYSIQQNELNAGEVNADPDDFVKDLNGKYVETNYEVESFEYVYDYVNYETFRAVMDDGLELYWLDVIYNKRNYRIQIPYYRYVALKGEGICRVEIEVLTLTNGSQIISYMQVVDFRE